MDVSNKTKIFNIIFSLIFLGVVLSFSLFFSMTALMRPEESISENFLNEKPGLNADEFNAYDNACLKNEMFHEVIVEVEFRLFGNIRRDGAVRGKRGFLFDVGHNSRGYDYITDYLGGYTLTEAELESLYDAVMARSKVYGDQGRQYVLAVIPNLQTVYSENMPAYFGGISKNTILSQLSAYMTEKGADCYLDLTGDLLNAKTNGVLYNNTENSINALGAYFVYNSIMSKLPEGVSAEASVLDLSDFEYYTHHTDGKATAVAVGLESLIENETVSMSNSTEFKYTVVNYSSEYETTYVKAAFRDVLPLNPYVLVECSDEWDKIQLMPYFSNTFGVTSYKVGHTYDSEVVDQSNPLVVIQTIHEDELLALLDSRVDDSYKDAIGVSVKPYMTGAPTKVEYTILDDSSICISGRIDQDAEVQIFGDGFDPIFSTSIEGMFFVKVTFDGEAEGREVFLNAKAPGKAASEFLTLSISGQNNVGSARDVLVGSNSMLYSTDYDIAYDLPPEQQLSLLEGNLYNLFVDYSRYNTAMSTKVIFALTPQKLSVYTDGLPEELVPQLERLMRRKSTLGAILGRAGADYLDLALSLRDRVWEGKMFTQTDNYLTDLAYYIMYCDIINAISRYDSSVKPMRADNFFEYAVPLSSGNLASTLGFDMSRITEVITKLRLSGNKDYRYNSDGSFISYGPNTTMPTAVIVHDGQSEPMIEMLTRNFSVAYVMNKGDIDISLQVLTSIKPDYIIYLCDEGNIDFAIRG